jgi:hypothetical protein
MGGWPDAPQEYDSLAEATPSRLRFDCDEEAEGVEMEVEPWRRA